MAGVSRSISIEDAGVWSKKPHRVVWIGLHEPDKALLERVAAQLDLHPLAIEDASKAHQRPKVEQYGDALFVVARTARFDDQIASARRIFLSERLRRVGPARRIDMVPGRAGSLQILPHLAFTGEDYILYAILDFIVDDYGPVIECVQAEVDAFEEEVLQKARVPREFDRLYRLRRDLLVCAGRSGRWSTFANGWSVPT